VSKKEREFTAKLLMMAAKELDNNERDDVDQYVLESANFTDEEKFQMLCDFELYNTGQPSDSVDLQAFYRLGDTGWMRFMAHKLMQDT
jgi:hypothetical protein